MLLILERKGPLFNKYAPVSRPVEEKNKTQKYYEYVGSYKNFGRWVYAVEGRSRT